MGKIELEFSCPVKASAFTHTSNGKHCQQCDRTLVDFTQKSEAEIHAIVNASVDQVCGTFHRSQLSSRFLQAASAVFLVTAAVPALAQPNWKPDVEMHLVYLDKVNPEKPEGTTVRPTIEPYRFVVEDWMLKPYVSEISLFEGIRFDGLVSTNIGLHPHWLDRMLEELKGKIEIPEGLTEEGLVKIMARINTSGVVIETTVAESYHPVAEAAAVQAVSLLDLPWWNESGNGPGERTLVFPIYFLPAKMHNRVSRGRELT